MDPALTRAIDLARARRFKEAESLAADAGALNLLASIAEFRGERERAVAILTDAARANRQDFTVNAHLAALLRDLGRADESIEYGSRALALRPDDVVMLNDQAISYTERGDFAQAAACFQRAIALDPRFPEPYNGLGIVAQQTARFDEAVTYFEKFLSLRPDAALGYVNLMSSYTVRSSDDVHLKSIEARLAMPSLLSESDRTLLHFAAAKAYHDLGRYGDCLRAAMRACELKRRAIRYDEAAVMAGFDDVRRGLSGEFMRRMHGHGFASPKPIFIISMPRSGSTLIEQILSSHPAVFGAGEIRDFVDALAEVHAGDAPWSGQFAANITPHSLARLGQIYADRISRRAPDAARIVDKMPSNFKLAGLIHLSLPLAKIIHVHRNPLDTCVSCFINHFASDLPHTYDLAELGRYYRAYHGLMDHWREVLPPGTMLDVSYESLVEDFAGQARRLLEYCGLPWDDAVLQPHKNRRAVKTLSALQVRQPINRKSIGRWREFETELRPLIDSLGDLAQPR